MHPFFWLLSGQPTHLPADCQPLNRLYAHLAAYITGHHTYFTGCETKNTAHAGCCKGNVNTPLSLIYQTKGRYLSTDHESLLRVSLRPLPPKSKATSNYQIVIFCNHSLSVSNSGNYTYAVLLRTVFPMLNV
jgi:hypothetical protein